MDTLLWHGTKITLGVVDYSNQTFLFSLANNLKFNQVNQQHTLFSGPSYGPYFGTSPDLYICDKANINQSSAYFGGSFISPIYPKNKNLYQICCGSSNGNFKVKEW